MAKNNFSLKTIAELEAMAKSYKTEIASFLEGSTSPGYEIADISKIEFNNITNFIMNSVIKNGKEIELAETGDSIYFSKILRKYFEEGLSIQEMISLKQFVNSYNGEKADYIYQNLYGYVYGITEDLDKSESNSPFSRIVSLIKNKLRNISENFDTSDERNVLKWYGSNEELLSLPKINATAFVDDYIQKSKIIEALVFLVIVSFTNAKATNGDDIVGRGAFFNPGSGTIERKLDRILEKRDFFKKGNNPSYLKDLNFTDEEAYSVDELESIRYADNKYTKRIQKSLEIKDSSNKVLFYIPIKIVEQEVVLNNGVYENKEGSSEIDVEIFNLIIVDESEKITFLDLYQQLKDNIYKFLDIIIDFEKASPEDYLYFFNSEGKKVITESIRVDSVKIARVFYYKDLIQDSSYLEQTEASTKNFANQFEQTIAKDGQQLLFIDIKDQDLSKESANTIATVRNVFGYPISISYPIGTFVSNKFTYTVLYKELNSVLRESCLIDNQEFIFARLLEKIGKNTIFQAKKGGISFSASINTLYKLYRESEELFKFVTSFYRYRYFYNNMYISRLSNESDLIGYYIGDSTSESSFTNNYGARDYEKKEISTFIDIYKKTRNFYYQILLNKSFIREEEYQLYERMIIIFMAIERFLNSKIENLHDLDYFNNRDIYNFLESYGLSILNERRFDFIIDGKNYKLNIIKYFNQLVKSKGSKNVINILLKVFEIPNISVEIRKFLMVDNTVYSDVDAVKGASSIKFVDVPYFSDNGTREINNSLSNALNYSLFIQDDPFWDIDDVPESKLLDLNLNVAETKYLGLILSENIYKKFILSRYMFSALDYLEKVLIKKDETDSVLYNTYLDIGELFAVNEEVSIYNYFEIIKILYKALLTLYGVQNAVENVDNLGTKFYGINKNINWEDIETFIEGITFNFEGNSEEFLVAERKEDDVETVFDRFNIYKESTDEWINYDPFLTKNKEIFYKKYDYSSLTNIAKQLNDLIFSTHKTKMGKNDIGGVYQNSGPFVIETIENLNLLRIDNTKEDLWMHILSKFYNKDYDIPSEKTFNPAGDNFDRLELYYKVLEKILDFPILYFDGLLSPYRNSELYHNKAFIDFVDMIMEEVYLSDEDPLAFVEYWIKPIIDNDMKLYQYNSSTGWSEITNNVTRAASEPADPDDEDYWIDTTNNKLFQYQTGWVELKKYIQQVEPTDSIFNSYLVESIKIIRGETVLEKDSEDITLAINLHTEKIIELINSLRTLFSSEAYVQFSLALKSEEQETLKFVQTAVEVFLSYTTELYYTTYKKSYNAYSEICPFSENIKQTLTSKKSDFVFYDENLIIELIEEGDE